MKVRAKTYILIFLFFLFVCWGCEDEIDIAPIGVAQSTIPANENDASGLLTGVYSTLSNLETHTGKSAVWREGWFIQWSVNMQCSDDIYKGGDSHGDQQYLEDLGYFKTGYNQAIDWKWRKMWVGIYRANYAINSIPSIEGLEQSLIDRYVAEAKFLRALFYTELLKNFGDVPMVTEVLGPDDVLPRSSSKAVYETIVEKDLKEAADILPQKGEYGKADMHRATRGAALCLLAKAYLYQEKWQDAYNTAKNVIEEKKYSLEPNFRDIFEIDNPDGVESVFEIAFSGDPSKSSVNQGWAGAPCIGSRNDGSWGWLTPSTDLDREFEEGDPRHPLTIIHNGDTYAEEFGGAPYLITPESSNQPPYQVAYKYYIPKSKRGNYYWKQPYNLQLIRYADLLLMYGEAALRLGKQTDADWAVEQIRARARNMSGDSSVLPQKNNVSIDDIIHERRVELATEGHRFNDLRRWGIAQQVLNALPAKIATYPEADYIGAKGALYQSPRNDLFAIPPSDVERAGWSQNPGY